MFDKMKKEYGLLTPLTSPFDSQLDIGDDFY